MNRSARQRMTVSAPVAVGVVVAALLALGAALVFGGAAQEKVVPGLGDAGTLTRWGLPVARLAMDLGGTLTVGALLMAVALIPSEDGALAPQAIRFLRGASWIAAVWAAAASVTLIFTVSDILGQPVRQILGNELSSYVGQLPQGVALMFVVLLAALVALMARTAATPGAAAGLLLAALAALLPPPLTGHSAASPNHELAVTGLALHVAALAPWVGGLAMVTWLALRRDDRLGSVAARFSRMALWCYVAVGASGALNAVSRLAAPVDLFTSRYGQLVLVKVCLFTGLGLAGRWHRARTLPLIAAGAPRAFARLAAAEVAVMAAAMGVAVALARTAPPPAALLSPLQDLLGYNMPPPLTVARLLVRWRFDLLFAVLAGVGGGLYIAGVRRLRRGGAGWPMTRSAAWFAGLAAVVSATMSGLATYAPVLFSAHIAQVMVLSVLAPALLAAGAPVTLLSRTLRPATVPGDRGPREWLALIGHSRAMKVAGHPLVAALIMIAGPCVVYFTSLFGQAMRAHLGHMVMLLYFLVAGALFFWVVAGAGPLPRPSSRAARMLALAALVPFYAIFGVALMRLGRPIGTDWYSSVHPPWAAPLLRDQHTGGVIAWAFGDAVIAVALPLLLRRGAGDRRERAEPDAVHAVAARSR